MAYFYYQKNIFGRWAPCMSEDQPITRTADGTKRNISQVIQLPAEERDLSFAELEAKYPLAPMSTILER